MVTNRAVKASPRFVRTVQRDAASSHANPVISVWNRALS